MNGWTPHLHRRRPPLALNLIFQYKNHWRWHRGRRRPWSSRDPWPLPSDEALSSRPRRLRRSRSNDALRRISSGISDNWRDEDDVGHWSASDSRSTNRHNWNEMVRRCAFTFYGNDTTSETELRTAAAELHIINCDNSEFKMLKSVQMLTIEVIQKLWNTTVHSLIQALFKSFNKNDFNKKLKVLTDFEVQL